MFQPKSLVALAGAEACKLELDDDLKFCVEAIATETVFTRRIRRNYVPSARGYALKKLWAEDFKRVHMQGRDRIHYLHWELARACVSGHPNSAQLLPRGYFDPRGGADDDVCRTLWAVNKSWALLDRAGVPHKDVRIQGRRQVHGLTPETILACLRQRQMHSLDKPTEMQCHHYGGTNNVCWRPPCGPPTPGPTGGDKDVPESLNAIFWDCE
ncbi:hypothetical protein AAVH_08179 [Aphelenchoides avenae]|nr:hypothetical protein AAVH_08179 [Aphelenchus avenae]